MYALCIESSNNRGMGHLFRCLLYIEYLEQHGIEYLLLINYDKNSLEILKKKKINYVLVNFDDLTSNWEKKIITKYYVDVWINDKFETTWQMGKHISDTNALFCLIDDIGEGEHFADINFAGMIYPTKKEIKGKYKFIGTEFIVLNPEIDKYKKERQMLERLVVSMGGSDPHGMTLQIVQELKKYSYKTDVVIGPNFKYKSELMKIANNRFKIYQNVPSLIKFFANYDFAITGGGVTCCEANAAGLPCMIIANAPHEINTGKFMENLGGCIYGGDYEYWDRKIFEKFKSLNINEMSLSGMQNFSLNAVQRIMEIIDQIQKAGTL